MKNQKGFSFIELSLTIFLLGLLAYSLTNFLTNSFRIWFKSSRQIDVQQKARIAIDEISRFLREAYPVTGIVIGAYGSEPISSLISFTDTDGNYKCYYKDADTLRRVVDTSTTTIIGANLVEVYFIPNLPTAFSAVDITSMTVQKGSGSNIQTIVLPRRRVYLRNQ